MERSRELGEAHIPGGARHTPAYQSDPSVALLEALIAFTVVSHPHLGARLMSIAPMDKFVVRVSSNSLRLVRARADLFSV